MGGEWCPPGTSGTFPLGSPRCHPRPHAQGRAFVQNQSSGQTAGTLFTTLELCPFHPPISQEAGINIPVVDQKPQGGAWQEAPRPSLTLPSLFPRSLSGDRAAAASWRAVLVSSLQAGPLISANTLSPPGATKDSQTASWPPCPRT